MTVPISSDQMSFVKQLVSNGLFPTEQAAVSAAIDLLRLRQAREEQLRAELQPSLDSLDRGEGLELDEEGLDRFFDDLIAGRE
jgi:Arc/MetJ-type ribon-helix-helix transcriptional regulator